MLVPTAILAYSRKSVVNISPLPQTIFPKSIIRTKVLIVMSRISTNSLSEAYMVMEGLPKCVECSLPYTRHYNYWDVNVILLGCGILYVWDRGERNGTFDQSPLTVTLGIKTAGTQPNWFLNFISCVFRAMCLQGRRVRYYKGEKIYENLTNIISLFSPRVGTKKFDRA
ncbi:hypothetical protein BDZ94DRAFT_1270233 [Collybia nuda]|uniref:Uncharacterized protein n=1 Tax=Collybia nuda TaxID=64659 RepID=A0A9P6CF24_9AGAR|nr:hypothetical protein BDZ94DRAFT_1270233 [Collybia nuda]